MFHAKRIQKRQRKVTRLKTKRQIGGFFDFAYAKADS